MKKIILLFAILSVATFGHAAVPVSVLSFKNKVGNLSCNQDWYWWSNHLSDAFQDMLLTELSKDPNINLLERENIQQINDLEVNLVNSEKSKHKINKGHFEKAKYTIMGAVTGYEYCAEKKGVNVSVSKVASFFGVVGAVAAVADTVDSVEFSKTKAKVTIDLRIVETETGRIIKTVKAEGESSRSNFNINTQLADYAEAKETPVGEAARMAIEKATRQFKTILN
ncbi:MAG: CsgG/HfaB family protein [Pseudobdellovibrio sp.]